MASKVESESYIPVGTIYFEEREDGLLHEKEMLKRTMLQHELTFKNQVHELHRLYRVQRDLMQEYQQNNNNNNTNNNSQTNSSSQNPPLNNNNSNNNNFDFIREGSAQSSSKNLPISIQNENGNRNGNGNVSIFGKNVVDLNENGGNGNVSNFGKRVALDLNEDGGNEDANISIFGKPVTDRNGINGMNGINGSGLDFLGVNKRVGFDEGSGSGSSKFGLDREKGGSSGGVNNFFNSQINPQQPILATNNNHHHNNNYNNPFPVNNNNNPNNNSHNNFFMNYKPAQQSIIFPNQYAVNPQLFPQSLTINFDPSQINDNENNNNPNNNNVSYPVLDSSPHYINLDKDKNKSPIPGFIHTVPVPVFNNGAFNAGTESNLSKLDSNPSFHYSNFARNPAQIPLQAPSNLPRNSNQPILFANPKSNLDRNLNLNEPAQEGIILQNNNNKGVKIFGANCEGSINKSSNGEDSKNPKSSSESNLATKLLGFPVFTNPNSSTNYQNSSSELKPLQNSVPDPKPLQDSVPDQKRAIIDLNEAYSPQENNTTNNNNNDGSFHAPSNEISNNKGKKTIITFDLNEDLSSCENDSSAIEAAHNILSLSTALKPAPNPNPLSWFATLAVTGPQPAPLPQPEPEPESETDSYEQMVLKLQADTTEERFGPGKYRPKIEEGQSSEQTGYGSLLFSKGKRGPARKRRQKRDFQRDVLPALASLSRVEVSEDLQLIGGLVRASGQEFDVGITRRVGRSGSTRRRQRNPPAQTGRADPPAGGQRAGAQTGRGDPPAGSQRGAQAGRVDPPAGSQQLRGTQTPAGNQRGGQMGRAETPGGGQRGVQTGRVDPLRGSPHGIPTGVSLQRQVNLPPRFPTSQMNLVHVNQVQQQQMNLVHVNRHQNQNQMNLVHVDQNQQHRRPQSQSESVIGWERFTRRARRPRGPPPAQQQQQQQQQHHQQQQQGINNNNNNGSGSNNSRNNNEGQEGRMMS